MLKIQISSIGPGQLIDVERSGNELHDEFFRTCTVMQDTNNYGFPVKESEIGDTSPERIKQLFGEYTEHWNRQFVVQVAGCPLKCWYCYVDNLVADKMFTCGELVDKFRDFKRKIPELNVFHFMGGCPGRYSYLWPLLRQTLDEYGFHDVILLTNVILVENAVYGQRPWTNIPERTLVDACIKGTNRDNFIKNTGKDMFGVMMDELQMYLGHKGVYYSMIEQDKLDEGNFTAWLGRDNIDMLKVKMYEATKKRIKMIEAEEGL